MPKINFAPGVKDKTIEIANGAYQRIFRADEMPCDPHPTLANMEVLILSRDSRFVFEEQKTEGPAPKPSDTSSNKR